MGMIMLYGMDVFKENTVAGIAVQQKLSVRHISASEAATPLRELLMPGTVADAPARDAPKAEIMIMALESRAVLDGFLDALKSAGVVVPLKAVVTPTNVNWTVSELIQEITKEHEAMSAGKGGRANE
ncbi:MAG: DUF3783 domain-containing protein [Clostridia bacterium]|nr:DUF3783 domain-containing protein [Clostridia bacterium]